MLVQAAAAQWQVDPASCTASNGKVMHAASGRALAYGDLVDAASALPVPKDPPLKDPKDFTLIGKPLKRFDTPNKTDGKVIYGIDAMLPGMKFATLAQCPVFGGKVAHVDDSAAKAVSGVRQVVVLDDLVAVVGDHMWAAKKGLDALVVTWDEGANAKINSSDIWEDLRAASQKDGVVAKSIGDVDKGLTQGDRFDGDYELPFLAHATMEPLNCTVSLTPGACEIWTGTQVMTRVQSAAAEAADLPVDKVTVHNHYIGGGFGRRLETDMVATAVRIAQHVDGPVKVVWTREEDIQHDIYRPVYRDVISASLSGGKIVAWKYRVSGSSIMARWAPSIFINGIDIDAVDSAVDMPYDIPNRTVEYVRAEPPAVPTGFWRGVGPNNNVFAIECFMDELARKAGMDPIDFRRGMLGNNPRLKAALDLVAEKSDWGKPLPPRAGRGVCVQPSFASFIATVVEAEVADNGEVHLRRVTSAVDTGIAVNPDTIVAQLQGGLIFGLTAALVWRDHHRQGSRAAIQLQRLPHAAHRPGAEHRRACHQERRGPRRHRRDRLHGRSAGAAQRDLCRDRRRAAPACRSTAPRSRPTRRKCHAHTHCRLIVIVVLIVAGRLRLEDVSSRTDGIRRRLDGCAGGLSRRRSDRRSYSAWPMRTKSNAANISRAPPTAWSATPRPAAPNMPAAWRFPLPFGTLYSPNITPDKETGIGDYSDQDFLNAVQRGIRRDGARLYPAMPFTSYTYMTDADALAIKAYLFSLPAVHADNRAQYFCVSVQSALDHDILVVAVQRRYALRAESSTKRRMEPRRLYRRSVGALRRMPHAAQSCLCARQPRKIRRCGDGGLEGL